MTDEKNRDIHSINAIGPFSHGIWTNGFEQIGDEEALSGRAQAIIDNFKDVMLQKYSIKEISGFSLVDIGCYDGFLTTEIEKCLPFKRIVGMEPRQKNIAKGMKIREYLGLHTSVDFVSGDIDTLANGSESFDIIFCSGVLHHTESTTDVLRKLKRRSNRGIFIECQTYAPLIENNFVNRLIDRFNKKVVEPKDIIYRFLPKTIGVCGFKMETDYYDGSAKDLSVVCLPSPKYLQTALLGVGFSEPEITLSPINFRKKILSQLRDFRAVCIFAHSDKPENTISRVDLYVATYEQDMLAKILSTGLLIKLGLIENKKSCLTMFYRFLINSQFQRNIQRIVNKIIDMMGKDHLSIEILKNIKYKPKDKLNFEYAKYQMSKGETEIATTTLKKIVGELNADWRTCYRAFALLTIINKQQNNLTEYEYYKNLLKTANPNYPLNILEKTFFELVTLTDSRI